MNKKFLCTVFGLTLLGSLHAQDVPSQDVIYEGYNGSRTVILHSQDDGEVTFLSEDKRYLSGALGFYGGFVYDLQENKVQKFEVPIHAYFSPTHYVASPAGENGIPYIMFNGDKKELEHSLNFSVYQNDLSYWAAQPNGKSISIMGYEFYNEGTDTLWANVALIYDGETGKIRKRLPSPWPVLRPFRDANGEGRNTGYGSRADAISADGTVVAGHGTWAHPDAFSNFSPTFWDLQTDTAFGIPGRDFSMGALYGLNRDGSILVGQNENTNHGLIIHYNRANKSFTLDTLLPLPGWDYLAFNNVAENGLITGFCGISAAPTSRMAVVYKDGELMSLQTYLYEYYNLDVPELGAPIILSEDGSVLAGYYNDRGAWVSWFVQLSDTPMLPRARDIKARASQKTLTVRVDWQAPLASDRTVTGYEIYRDEEATPLATVDADITTYTDYDVEAGEHTYHIIAVYGAEKSIKAQSNTVLAVEGGNFPVQQVQHLLKHNRYASIYWGLPSSEIIATANASIASPLAMGEKATPTVPAQAKRTSRPAKTAAKTYTNPAFDYISNVNTQMFDAYAGLQVDDEYFATSWKREGIRVIDQFGQVTRILRPDGLNSATFSMVRIQNETEDLLFCGGLEDVNVIDLKDTRRVKAFTEDVSARFMTYMADVTVDGHTGVFLMGDDTAKYYYRNDANKLIYIRDAEYDFSGLTPSGVAYYNNKLYVYSQTGPYLNELYTFDARTHQQIGDPIQPMEDPAVQLVVDPYFDPDGEPDPDVAYAGGLGICMLEDSTVALVAGAQCNFTHCRLVFMELESAPMRESYTLYRDGEILADNLKTRRYTDELTAGSYNYHVVVNVVGGKKSAESPKHNVKIDAYDPCNAPINLQAREINRWATLSWDVPDGTTGVVGFNLYRDGELLANMWREKIDLDYTDFSELELNREYVYRVESLYESGCVASAECKITLTDQGKAMAPFGLHVDYTKEEGGFKPTVTWETPLLEEPLSIGYGTAQALYPVTLDEEVTEYWAAIGYDSTNLDLYKDLCLIGMEYFLGEATNRFDVFVYLNDTLKYVEALPRTQAGEWQTQYFKQSFSMDQPDEVVWGYHTTYSGATPLAVDPSFNKPFFSDLMSFDGVEWYSMTGSNIQVSHAIRGLVARKYDLDAATTNGVIDYSKLEGKIMRVSQEALPVSLQMSTADSWKQAPKAALTLRGFNLYRERVDIASQEEQLNDALLTTFTFEDKVLPAGDYTYTVEADYGSEKKSASVDVTLEDVSTEDAEHLLSLTLYPNPATEVVYVNGEYRDLQILDLSGRVLRQQAAASQINIGYLTPGTYFFRFTAEDGRGATYKVVVR